MSALSAAIEAADLPALIVEHCGPEAVRGLHPARGGAIRDPRPGHEETNPSFSVYKSGPTWRWKRHGSDEAGGTAYDFLRAVGYSGPQAREDLLRRAGLADTPTRANRPPAPVRPDPLAQVHAHLAGYSPLSTGELNRLPSLVAPLHPSDDAALDLKRRGLWPLAGTGKLRRDFKRPDGRLLAHRGALTLDVRGPDGRPWALKIRNLGGTLNRYVYRLAGHGNPAHCSEGYGQADAVLLIEGELNGAAASLAAQHAGLSLDVQGLASAGGVPHLEGLKGRSVFLSFDDDKAGHEGLERVARIAQEAGAAEVRVLPFLVGGLDCCDLLGAGELAGWLTHALSVANGWQPAMGGNTPLPPNAAAPSGPKSNRWQCGATSQGWTASNDGWDSPNWGGW